MDIGADYNRFMEMLPLDSDWGLFLDHDAMFTTKDWYIDIDMITDSNNIGMYSCMTNRIGNEFQIPDNVDRNNHDILYHRKIGADVRDKNKNSVTVVNHRKHPISGVMILIKKSVWNDVGGFCSGFFGVDTDIHARCNKNGHHVGIMNGIYVYHFYRGDGDNSHVDTAKEKFKQL